MLHDIQPFFEAKFLDYPRLLENTCSFAGAVAADSLGFEVVVKGVMEPMEVITGLEMAFLCT